MKNIVIHEKLDNGKKEYAITSLEEKKEILECECSAKYEIEYKKVMRAVVKQV